tara:strand:- start:1826 stop:2050 length:225 start_codon:yes stop_codon:yes gene_type:complete
MSRDRTAIYQSATLFADFIGDTVCNNLTEAFHQNKLECSEAELNKILNYVRVSITQGATQGMRGIEATVESIVS